MCLKRVDRERIVHQSKPIKAFKVFHLFHDELYHYYLPRNRCYKIGYVYQSARKWVETIGPKDYISGFHAFRRKRDAIAQMDNWPNDHAVVYPVLLWGRCTIGMDGSVSNPGPAVVGEFMKILPTPKR